MDTFAAVSTGNDQVCARKLDGALYCWGGNSSGQLGHGDAFWALPQPVK
jgi:alpha-tubulin suppressor-like RCC1 family protein